MRLFCGNFAEKVVKLPILKISHRIIYYIVVTYKTTNDYGKEKESEESRGAGKEECC